MKIWDRLFGSSKAIDAGINTVDKIFYTAEEKADDGLKARLYKLKFLGAYEAYKIAQRLIALMLAIPFVLIHIIAALFWFVLIGFAVSSGGDHKAYEFGVAELLKIADMNNRTLGEPFAWVVIFYYAGGAGEGMINKFMSSRRTEAPKK